MLVGVTIPLMNSCFSKLIISSRLFGSGVSLVCMFTASILALYFPGYGFLHGQSLVHLASNVFMGESFVIRLVILPPLVLSRRKPSLGSLY